jgi:putative flippase GtrA
MKRLIKQVLGFGVVGVICFLIDYLLIIALTEMLHTPYLFSCVISFSASTVVNYFMSMSYIFQSKEGMKKSKEFILFVVMSVIGLGLTVLLMRVSVEKIGLDYRVAKIVVTGIVMVYNFFTRKVFLDGGEKSQDSVRRDVR